MNSNVDMIANHLYLSGFIAASEKEPDGYISADAVKKALKGVTGDITVHVNIAQGFIDEALKIHDILKNYRYKVTAQIDGIAGDSAVPMIMAADAIRCRKSSMVMISQPWTVTFGSVEELRQEANILDAKAEHVRDLYMSRFKGQRSKLKALMEGDTFMTAEEAHRWGLVDELIEDNHISRGAMKKAKQVKTERKGFWLKFQ